MSETWHCWRDVSHFGGSTFSHCFTSAGSTWNITVNRIKSRNVQQCKNIFQNVLFEPTSSLLRFLARCGCCLKEATFFSAFMVFQFFFYDSTNVNKHFSQEMFSVLFHITQTINEKNPKQWAFAYLWHCFTYAHIFRGCSEVNLLNKTWKQSIILFVQY